MIGFCLVTIISLLFSESTFALMLCYWVIYGHFKTPSDPFGLLPMFFYQSEYSYGKRI